MLDTPKGSHRVLLSKEELKLIVGVLQNAREDFEKTVGELNELENDLRMVLAGTL